MSVSTGKLAADGKNWEGYGGPIRVDRTDNDDHGNVDPTLDECCRRDAVAQQRQASLRRTLQRYDVVAERERRRRNLLPVVEPSSSDNDDCIARNGQCRCVYDPNRDGGEYRALSAMRALRSQKAAERQEVEEKEDDHHDNDHELPDDTKSRTNIAKNDVADGDESDDEFDYLLDEDLSGNDNAELKALEESRRWELEMELECRQVAWQHGYGRHRQVHPSRVLQAAGLFPGMRNPPPAVVLHLVDPDSSASASLDLFLEEQLLTSGGGGGGGNKYQGTIFLRASGRSTLLQNAALTKVVLPGLSPDRDLPALVAVKDGVAIHTCPKLHGLVTDTVDDDNDYYDDKGFSSGAVVIVPEAVTDWLDRSGVLLERAPPLENICRIRPEEDALLTASDYYRTTSPPDSATTTAQQPEPKWYNCGIPNCCKTFAHEHIGVSNDEQEGLVVSEDEILGESVQ